MNHDMTQTTSMFSAGGVLADRVCYFCSHGDAKTLAEKEERFIKQCLACGYIYTTPTFTVEEFRDALKKAYCNDETSFYRELKEKEKDRAFESALFRERLKQLSRLLGNRKGSIFEVGSGAGFFLKTAMDEGWDAHGIEISESAYRYATQKLGLKNVTHGLFLDVDLKGQQFDVIVLDNVLEHHINPVEFLLRVREHLKDGGCILIEVPNDFNSLQLFVHRFLGYPLYWCFPTIHLSYFSPKTLSWILSKTGFQSKIVQTELPVELFLLLGIDYTKRKWARSFVRNFNKSLRSFIINLSPLSQFYRAIDSLSARLNIGRMLTVYAAKNSSLSQDE
jgi:2-polyprenyl-3-methyl-5-hydroxy-6-metoxy-1,4-benzoquinol methylase